MKPPPKKTHLLCKYGTVYTLNGHPIIYISSASTTFISDVQLETWLEPRTGESNGFTGFESALFTLSCGVEDPVT